MKNDREKLYALDRHGRSTVAVPFDPLLLAVLGYYNPLKPEHRPDLDKVEEIRGILSGFGISI